MSSKGVVARNVLWNGAGLAVPLLAGFLLAPFLIHQLGAERNGLWVLILLWIDSFTLLDLGVSGSVGRGIAYHRARGEPDQASAVLSTSCAVLCGVGLLVLAATGLVPLLFFQCNEVPADEAAAVTTALLIVGLSVALSFPLTVFDASLWALQRFDVINAVDIPAALLRTGLTFLLVWSGYGLVSLALVALAMRVGTGLLKGWYSFRLDPGLRLRYRLVSRTAAQGLFGYSVWAFVLAVTRMLGERIGPQVIGARLGVALVTPQSVAAKLVNYSNGLMIAGTEVLTPHATHLHADQAHEQQKDLLLGGGKVCLTLAVFFAGFFLLLGKPFLTLWVGTALAETAYPLLVILILGETLPLSQWVSYNMALAMSRHRGLALMCLAENAVATAGALVLVGSWGLVGACVGVAVPAALFRGVGQIVYGCRLVHATPADYLGRVVLPTVTAAGLPVLGLALLCGWEMPTTWCAFVAYGGLYAATFAAAGGLLLVGYRPLKLHTATLLRGLRRLPEVEAAALPATSPETCPATPVFAPLPGNDKAHANAR